MFNPDGCFCCEPPEDPCVLSGCTWSSTAMSDADLTAGTTYNNPSSGSTPDGTYEVTNVQDTSTGNDAPCRKITIETAVAPSKAESVYAICWKDNATHNPSTQCPLTSVSFCVESKRHADADSGLTDGVVFVVRQNGKIYATATQAVGVNWKRASGTYTSASFTWVNGTGNPNFTATGSAIEFGFALKLSVPKDGTPYDVVMFDNLCITKNSQFCVTCNNGCDAVDEGSSTLTPIASSGGVAYSGISSFGNPGPSHMFTVSANGDASARASDSLADMLSADCRKISAVAICIDVEAEGTGGGLLVGSGVGTSTSSSIQYSTIQVSQPGWLKIERVVNIPSNADLSTLFLAVGVRVTFAGISAMNVYIDNICAKAVYSDCLCECVSDYHVDVSGANIKVPGLTCTYTGVGCSASDGSYVLTKSTHASANVPVCSYKSPFVPLGVCPFYETNNGVRFAWVLTPFEINGNMTATLKLTAVTWTGSAPLINYNVARFDCPNFSCETGGVFTGYSSGEMTDGWMYACGGPSSLTVSVA